MVKFVNFMFYGLWSSQFFEENKFYHNNVSSPYFLQKAYYFILYLLEMYP